MELGLTRQVLWNAVELSYATLDMVDEPLLRESGVRLSEIVELANLSSMVGNVLSLNIVRAAGGLFEKAGPHKYQDLRAAHEPAKDIEVKVALETNRPKGHLPKSGHCLTCRYVLGDVDGGYSRKKRGNVVWIWELRVGHLELEHFSISNTAGDSGKTAVVTAEGMKRLQVVYFDKAYCPYVRLGRFLRECGIDGEYGGGRGQLPLIS